MAQITVRQQGEVRQQRSAQNRFWTSLGLFFLFAFAVQALLSTYGVKWVWLADLQAIDLYAKWSGVGLALYLGSQWILPVMRMAGKHKQAKRFYDLHKKVGVFAPLFFYIHSMQFGYAYMAVLASVYFSNVALGLFSVDVISDYIEVDRRRYSYWWMILHVALSFLTMGLMIYHTYIAYAYK